MTTDHQQSRPEHRQRPGQRHSVDPPPRVAGKPAANHLHRYPHHSARDHGHEQERSAEAYQEHAGCDCRPRPGAEHKPEHQDDQDRYPDDNGDGPHQVPHRCREVREGEEDVGDTEGRRVEQQEGPPRLTSQAAHGADVSPRCTRGEKAGVLMRSAFSTAGSLGRGRLSVRGCRAGTGTKRLRRAECSCRKSVHDPAVDDRQLAVMLFEEVSYGLQEVEVATIGGDRSRNEHRQEARFAGGRGASVHHKGGGRPPGLRAGRRLAPRRSIRASSGGKGIRRGSSAPSLHRGRAAADCPTRTGLPRSGPGYR